MDAYESVVFRPAEQRRLEREELDTLAEALCEGPMAWSYEYDHAGVPALHYELHNISPDRLRELAGREAEVARLREALVALVAHDPLIPSEYSKDCFYCDGFLSFGAYYKDGYIHDDDCPWAKAKALLP